MLYNLRYNVVKKQGDYSTVEKYDNDLHRLAYRLFMDVRDKNVLDIKSLKTLWANLWINKKRKFDFVYTVPKSWRDSYQKYNAKGIKALVSLYECYCDNPGNPILINTPYNLNITKEIALTGTIDLVREVTYDSDKVLELVCFKTDTNRLRINYDLDMEVTASLLAFSKKFNLSIDKLVYHNIETSKSVTVHRDKKNIIHLVNTIVNIDKCISNDIYYQVAGDKCNTCSYHKECLKLFNDCGKLK